MPLRLLDPLAAPTPVTGRTGRRPRRLLLPPLALAAGLILASCGGSTAGVATSAGAASATSAAVTSAAALPAGLPTVISLRDVPEYGKVLTDEAGLTLYAFTADDGGTPTCVDKCLAAWPALVTTGEAVAGSGLDASKLTTVTRPDGGTQLKYGTWPLYYYAGDAVPGDTIGQGVNDKWFVVGADGTLIKEAAPAASASPSGVVTATVSLGTVGALGSVLVDAAGITVYAFTADEAGTPTCVDKCLAAWPALLVDGSAVAGTGLDASKLTTVARPDGGTQVKYGTWPLYYYAGDAVPGDAIGQGVNDKWFVVAADGTLVKPIPAAGSAAPAPSAAPAAAPVVGLATVGNLGEVMVGANGNTVYAFANDTQTSTACVDACAAAWPPLIVEPGFTVSDELSANGVSTLTRPDGSLQLVMGAWPLYYYAGDAAPGDALGQGLNDKWYVVSAQCTLVKTAA